MGSGSSTPIVHSKEATTSIQEGGLHVFEVHTPSASIGATTMIIAIIISLMLITCCYLGVRQVFANLQISRQHTLDYHPYEVIHYQHGPNRPPSLPAPGQQSDYDPMNPMGPKVPPKAKTGQLAGSSP